MDRRNGKLGGLGSSSVCVEKMVCSRTQGSSFDCAASLLCDLGRSLNFSGLQFPHLGKRKDHNIHIAKKNRTIVKWDFANVTVSPGCPRPSSPGRKSQPIATPQVTPTLELHLNCGI